MRNQHTAVTDLFAEPSFTMIVLDSCRYDAFADHVTSGTLDCGEGTTLTGTLSRTVSPATHTYVWLQRMFTASYPRTHLFSGHPAINSEGVTPDEFVPTVNRQMFAAQQKWSATNHFQPANIHDAWAAADDAEHFKTPPRHVTAEVEATGYRDRNIVWLMAPHHPYSDDGDTPRERYENTLADALTEVASLVRDAPGRVVITSDHGESFRPPADYGLDLGWKDQLRHEPGLRVPELTNVPWFEVAESGQV